MCAFHKFCLSAVRCKSHQHKLTWMSMPSPSFTSVSIIRSRKSSILLEPGETGPAVLLFLGNAITQEKVVICYSSASELCLADECRVGALCVYIGVYIVLVRSVKLKHYRTNTILKNRIRRLVNILCFNSLNRETRRSVFLFVSKFPRQSLFRN